MKKKLLLAPLFLFLGTSIAESKVVKITTSCRKTIYLETNDYASTEELIKTVQRHEEAACATIDVNTDDPI